MIDDNDILMNLTYNECKSVVPERSKVENLYKNDS